LLDQADGSFSEKRLAATPVTWIGGPTVASDGETVNVQVSADLPADEGTPQTWADFIAGLDHGSELSALTARIATLPEIQSICGTDALGCYGDDELYAIGGTLEDGTSPQEVVRHEYGHHVAQHRVNTPWNAVDWGPKNWASNENVCAQVVKGQAYPGDEGDHYAQNPGEAWAETYRILEEQKAGITTGSWQIVAPSYYPNTASLAAARQDVLQPWTAEQKAVYRHTFTKNGPKVWWIHLTTPLDGSFSLTAALPGRGLQTVTLVGPNKTTTLKRAYWAGARSKKLSSTICGQRSLYVEVTQKGAPGRVSVAIARP
jgi:hypothetical protein